MQNWEGGGNQPGEDKTGQVTLRASVVGSWPLPIRRRLVLPVAILLALLPAQLVQAAVFASEHRVGTAAQRNWEPTVATDPVHSNLVYQAVTALNRSACKKDCPSWSIMFRASDDGGETWGEQQFLCTCRGTAWQADPQLKVASDEEGTIYAAWMNTFKPGVVLSKSSDHGEHWTIPVQTNGGVNVSMDKPILEISPSGRDVYIAFDGGHNLAPYVTVSHNYGATFSAPILVSTDGNRWLPYGGAVGAHGAVYFAFTNEPPTSIVSFQDVQLVRSFDAGSTWTAQLIDKSAEPPPCLVRGCYPDFFGPEGGIAIDKAGTIMLAYNKNRSPKDPLKLYERTSRDGVVWSAPTLINARGDSEFTQLAAGSAAAGDFRVAWQDNRNSTCGCQVGGWNTWLSQTLNTGASWSPAVQLSNRGNGAPYKTAAGYNWPFGDYFGLAVNGKGTNFVIWGEGQGVETSGGVWFTRGP